MITTVFRTPHLHNAPYVQILLTNSFKPLTLSIDSKHSGLKFDFRLDFLN